MSAPALAVEGLDVHYGRAHVLQGVSFTLERGVLAIVGRNGMGKTTLCNAITGLLPASGSVKLFGEEIRGLAPHRITQRGIAYVPQGRRVWPSLSVDETLAPGGARRSATSSASTRCSRAWPSARTTAARSFRAARRRCSRSAAPSCSSRSCS